MRKPIVLSITVLLSGMLCLVASSQGISAADKKILQQKEDSLQLLAKSLIVDSLTEQRMRNDSLFIKTLIRALQVKNSFKHPFDSVAGISKLYAPDSSFRIFTWTLSFDEYYSRQRGAIQVRTRDGSLKLLPLRDYSEFTKGADDSLRDRMHWIGAVYYRIIQTEYQGKKYYTLFGFDDNSVRSNKKWIDVLSFNDRNEPVFGGHFSFEQDTVARARQYRYHIEYKKDASTYVNYDDELKLIIVDHLISESDEPENKWTYVPDGDYEGFQWKNGRWVHIEKVFHEKLLDGQAPVPNPIRDGEGNELPPLPKKKKGEN